MKSMRHETKAMKIAAAIVGAAIAAASLSAGADQALATAKGCTACHAVDKKVVGPAYKDVGRKYKAEKDGSATMVASILKGSQGKWGPIPMPPNKVSEEEAKALAAWIGGL